MFKHSEVYNLHTLKHTNIQLLTPEHILLEPSSHIIEPIALQSNILHIEKSLYDRLYTNSIFPTTQKILNILRLATLTSYQRVDPFLTTEQYIDITLRLFRIEEFLLHDLAESDEYPLISTNFTIHPTDSIKSNSRDFKRKFNL